MSAAQSTALTKRDASTALMAPPPMPKRIKRPNVVLDEDTYVSAVSHIIRRDFFPGLAEADAQREYLNAVESKNKSWIREAGKKLTHVMTPVPSGRRRVLERTRFDRPGGSGDKTPSVWGADTPVTVAPSEAGEDDEGLGKLDNVDLNLSLGAFQAKYISEDQESFSQIIDKQNEKKFEKNAWLREGNRYASKQRIAQQKVIQARAAANESKELVVTTRPSQNLDDRPAAPIGTKHEAFNTLMFGPDSVESWAPTRAQAAESASFAPPKQVAYNNTRLPAPEVDPPRAPSPTLSFIRASTPVKEDTLAAKPHVSRATHSSKPIRRQTTQTTMHQLICSRNMASMPQVKPRHSPSTNPLLERRCIIKWSRRLARNARILLQTRQVLAWESLQVRHRDSCRLLHQE
jgi:protein DGCR14